MKICTRYLANQPKQNPIFENYKLGIDESMAAANGKFELLFEIYIYAARCWIEWLKKDIVFSKVFGMGHSETWFFGMIASLYQADGFTLAAGAGGNMNYIFKIVTGDKSSTLQFTRIHCCP